jgi:cytochrome c oxidase subunit I+III
VKLRWGIAVAVLVVVAAVIRWNWPQEPPMSVEEEEAFEREHHVAVNAGGSVVVATWGMGLAILFVGIAFASLLLTYFYLRLENPLWPPVGVAEPRVAWASIGAALIVVSSGALYAGLRRVRAGDQPGFIRGLVAALVLAGSGAVVQFRDVAQLDLEGTAHAYGSIFYTMTGFVAVVEAGAMIMLAMALLWAVRGQYNARRHAAVTNIARFWIAAVVVWVVGFGTLYLGPHLT